MSSIRFNCPTCGKSLNVAAQHAGRRAKCPKCQEALTVPETPPEAASPAPETTTPPATSPKRRTGIFVGAGAAGLVVVAGVIGFLMTMTGGPSSSATPEELFAELDDDLPVSGGRQTNYVADLRRPKDEYVSMLVAHGADAVPICVRRARGQEGKRLSVGFAMDALKRMDASLLPLIYEEGRGWRNVHTIAIHMPGDAVAPLVEILPNQDSPEDQLAVVGTLAALAARIPASGTNTSQTAGTSVSPESVDAAVTALEPLARDRGDLGFVACRAILTFRGLTPQTRKHLLHLVRMIGPRQDSTVSEQGKYVLGLIEQDDLATADLVDELISMVESENHLGGLMLARMGPTAAAAAPRLIALVDAGNATAGHAVTGTTYSWAPFTPETRSLGVPLGSISEDKLREWLGDRKTMVKPYVALKVLHTQGGTRQSLLPEVFGAMDAMSHGGPEKARCVLAVAQQMGATAGQIMAGCGGIARDRQSHANAVAEVLEQMAKTSEERAWAALLRIEDNESVPDETLAALGDRSHVAVPVLAKAFLWQNDAAAAQKTADTIVQLDPEGELALPPLLTHRRASNKPGLDELIARFPADKLVGPLREIHLEQPHHGTLRLILDAQPQDPDIVAEALVASFINNNQGNRSASQEALKTLTPEQRLATTRRLITLAKKSRNDPMRGASLMPDVTQILDFAVAVGAVDQELAQDVADYVGDPDCDSFTRAWKLLGVADPDAEADLTAIERRIMADPDGHDAQNLINGISNAREHALHVAMPLVLRMMERRVALPRIHQLLSNLGRQAAFAADAAADVAAAETDPRSRKSWESMARRLQQLKQ